MNDNLIREVRGLADNLKYGVQLLILRQPLAGSPYVSGDQPALLLLAYALLVFGVSYVLSLPEPEFNPYGITSIATQSLLLFLAAYTAAKTARAGQMLLPLLVALLSVWPWLYLAWHIIGAGENFSYWQFYSDEPYRYTLYHAWVAVVFATTTARTLGANRKVMLIALGSYTVLAGLPLQLLSYGPFWQQAFDDDGEYEKYLSINEEDTYYRQFEFIESLQADLLKERSGISDIYFIGFGGDAMEDVFMKEVQYARNVFDERFDTKGRSVALINNIKTLNETPLASKGNLERLVQHIGSLMNPDEDILFMYLTSHGSENQQLLVDLMPLGLNQIGPQELKEILDKAGIKYRVLLVSSCYSGGFVEPLHNEYTVVVTASAADKTSFGCGNKSDFTYFGKALFEEQLRHNFNFLDAFRQAIQSIQRREREERIKPSDPQLFIGDVIKTKLGRLSRELELHHDRLAP
ncbi:MAG: C13 family peptidase [Pseudomonadota bacterium]